MIRSKGVGIYFITQSPLDIPDNVLGQMGMKIQHALRAYTPKDRKVIRSVADSFRANPAFDTESVITELGTGEALVSVLNAKGAPQPVQRTLIRPPESRIGPLKKAERKAKLVDSPMAGKYDQAVDRESAYELLRQRAETTRCGTNSQRHCCAQKNRQSGRNNEREFETARPTNCRGSNAQEHAPLCRQLARPSAGARPAGFLPPLVLERYRFVTSGEGTSSRCN